MFRDTARARNQVCPGLPAHYPATLLGLSWGMGKRRSVSKRLRGRVGMCV